MAYLTKLKKGLQRFSQIIAILPTVLLIFGCFYIFVSDDLLSFIFSVTLPILFVLNLIIGVYWLFKKSRYSFLALVGLIIFFFNFDSFIQFNNLDSGNNGLTNSDVLTILSYNTHGFKHGENDKKGSIDKRIVDFIKYENTDVFCIQEFSAIRYKDFEGYPYFFKTNLAAPGKSVMSIFSKYPIQNKGCISFPNTNNNAMFVDVLYEGEIIRVYNLHLESYKTDAIHQLNNPKSYSALIKRISKAEKDRKEQAFLVKNHIDSFNGKVIICGDFNATQFSSSYGILNHSMKDTFLEVGNGFGTTYRLYNYPFRLDYILVDDNFEIKLHQNFELKLSDHEPIIAKLTLLN